MTKIPYLTEQYSQTFLSGFLAVGILLMPFTAIAQGISDQFAIYDNPRPAPELKFVLQDGSALTLADFNGQVLLLNVWATWCAPCRREMPTLDRLQAELGGPAFEVVAFSIDRGGVEVVKKFYDEIGIKHLKIYVDSTTTALRKLKIVGLPTTLLLDTRGQQLGALIGPAEWDTPEMIEFLRAQIAKAKE